MGETKYKVTIAKDLEDLIPTYLGNRRKELDALRAALSAADFEQLRRLGHRMRGVGKSYGFQQVTAIGEQIEAGARSADTAALAMQIADYGDFLSKVQIAFE